MTIIDFRIRPPFKELLSTAMYSGAERRDRMTRSLGFEPSPAAQQQSVDLIMEIVPPKSRSASSSAATRARSARSTTQR